MGVIRSKDRGGRWSRSGFCVDNYIGNKNRILSRVMWVERWFGGYMDLTDSFINALLFIFSWEIMESLLDPIYLMSVT